MKVVKTITYTQYNDYAAADLQCQSSSDLVLSETLRLRLLAVSCINTSGRTTQPCINNNLLYIPGNENYPDKFTVNTGFPETLLVVDSNQQQLSLDLKPNTTIGIINTQFAIGANFGFIGQMYNLWIFVVEYDDNN